MDDDDSTDEESGIIKKGGQKRKVAADIKAPAKKSKLDKVFFSQSG